MTRYFFNVPGFGEPDEEGSELPDFATARREAIRLAADMLYAEAGSVETLALTMTDAGGARLLSINFELMAGGPDSPAKPWSRSGRYTTSSATSAASRQTSSGNTGKPDHIIWPRRSGHGLRRRHPSSRGARTSPAPSVTC